ncbi:hypothetical protein [Natranaerobius trueperi]|uniref:Uncharacterized protein n=1 Tax=Natranaerobius trueperi TaxID=759412 RepID=A0A226C0F6_9FIRM|nr:hypothetical protein [Natranaerobius trueperi]OWZ84716.1 hypothetical protein CDO51_01430 [Natranaerobius trueperi]
MRKIKKIENQEKMYKQPDVKEIMKENAEEIYFGDVLALTIAGLQVLAPRVLLFFLSYLFVIVFFIMLWN